MIVFDIKRYAINDGPGIRTTVFLKGCPLRCIWCHNPESWLSQPELLFKQKKCIGCNSCGIHPHQLEFILHQYSPSRPSVAATLQPSPSSKAQPSTLAQPSVPYAAAPLQPSPSLPSIALACPTLALEMCGRDYTLEELLAEIEKERDIMQDSGGGVTISGGEPLMSRPLSLLRALGERGFHRCVDTTLFASPDTVRDIAAETDLFLVDLKVMDPELHKRYTGVSNEIILKNLKLLADLGSAVQIRIPLIEGINADEGNIDATASFLESISMPIKGVSLLPYHEMGRDKHARRGTTYNPQGIKLSTPSDETQQRIIRQFADHHITATIGG